MRRWPILLLVLLLFPPTVGAHHIGSPRNVSFLLDHFLTPDLAPGERGPFTLTFRNTYPWNMTNVSLRLEVYRYREIDVDLPVLANWTGGPDFVDDVGIDRGQSYEPVVLGPNNTILFRPNESRVVSFTVVTYPETRHGSVTKQGSYFVRTRLEFDLGEGAAMNHSWMMSRGYFTDVQFATAARPCLPANSTDTCPGSIYYEGDYNMTYLGSVYGLPQGHLDGLIPDTAFSVAERMPTWPYVAIGGAMVAFLVLAILFYAEENPAKYPRLARWWLGVKGKSRRPRSPKRT